MELTFIQTGTYRETVHVNISDDEVNEKIMELKRSGYNDEEIADAIQDWITDHRWEFDTDYEDTDYDDADDWEWDDDTYGTIEDAVKNCRQKYNTSLGEME